MINKLFLRQLKRLDKFLTIEMDKEKERFIVKRRDRQGYPREILIIETPNGSFSYPTYSHIVQLHKIDVWQNPNLIQEIDKYNENIGKEGEDHIKDISERVSGLITRSKYF